MTAYLQPGDKIHLAVPGDFTSKARGERIAQELVKSYESRGIEVFALSMVMNTLHPMVISVIRSPKAVPVPPWQAHHPDPA
jgi:hypothetical protein